MRGNPGIRFLRHQNRQKAGRQRLMILACCLSLPAVALACDLKAGLAVLTLHACLTIAIPLRSPGRTGRMGMIALPTFYYLFFGIFEPV